jgi:hypothetical protein
MHRKFQQGGIKPEIMKKYDSNSTFLAVVAPFLLLSDWIHKDGPGWIPKFYRISYQLDSESQRSFIDDVVGNVARIEVKAKCVVAIRAMCLFTSGT